MRWESSTLRLRAEMALVAAEAGSVPQRAEAILASLRQEIAEALDRLPSFAEAARLTDDALGGLVITRGGRHVPVPGLPTHPLLTEGSAALVVASLHAHGPGAASTFLSPWAGSLVRVSVRDCRDETADHLSMLALVRSAGEAEALAPSDVRLLGALVEGWDDGRVRALLGLSDPAARTDELARRLGLQSSEALVQHATREGLYLPPMLLG